ncbi:uncharacterized protein AC631_01285 [Debaryomyces fabryi]|uniref:Nucleoporin NUP1 n=1 Tax=Debaryomyces fabryi TaxID=58627 RepID=A0A0V1Q329_9ASCO|nr:uncharacterized protein AC631_01285 [Debaryomyces fabryi]KSA02920.1 hypothetical protein AC631_01285 [Debaryomyces fabryi]CUM50882.1 unnamed protein product [Debaryomyces fabryi]
MSYDRKRPISPHTVEKENEGGFGISKLFNFLKPRSSQQYKQQKQRQNQIPSRNEQEVSRIEPDPLVNNFSSSRKRTLSIQSLHNNGVVPRSSTLNTNYGSYTNCYDSLKNENEVLDNDLERRLSTEYGDDLVKESMFPLSKSEFQERDESPMSDLMKPRPSILSEINKKENQDNMPIIIEHEFAPLYKDSDGNLVRPPFINLDPRERYHVLQLKKSIQASESLQNRIKYMVNPNETQSKPLQEKNKVETSTQTHDSNYLENSLNFSSLKRRLLAKKDRSKSKRAKNIKGYFSGEFLYDSIDGNEKSKDELHGYLGDVAKPKFKNNTSINKNDKSTSVQPRKDESQIFNRFSNQNIKSTDNRIGLDKSLLSNEKVNVSLDSDYVAKSEKVSNIIKLKADSSNKPKEKESVQPSSGFKFSINSNDINSIINKKQEDDELVNKSNGALSKDEDNTKPSFSFGTSTDKKETGKPLFSFDSSESKNGSANKPAFSFGTSNVSNGTTEPTLKRGRVSEEEEPSEKKDNSTNQSFSFGASSDKKEVSKPKFTFGASSEKTDNDKPTVSFGSNETKNASNSTKPSFSFGVTPEKKEDEVKPSFSFGTAANNKDEMPKQTFAFGKPSDNKDKNNSDGLPAENKGTSKPAFTFGASTEKKEETAKPELTFGTSTEKKEDTTKPSFTFGASTDKKEDSAKPAFTFGAPTEKKDDSSKPTFTFGVGTEKKEEAPKPTFTFGAGAEKKEETSKPAFTFGAGAEKKEETPKPAFTFGAGTEKKEEAPKPAFTFGAGTEKKDDTVKPAFNFGAPKETPKQALAFGANEKKETTPSFSFGEKPAGTIGVPAFGAARDSTPKPFEKPTAAFGSGSTTPNFSFGSKETTPKPNFSFASGTGANAMPSNAPQSNNLFNFTGTVNKEGTPDPASIFGSATNVMNANNIQNGMNGLNKSAESSPFGFNAHQGKPDFKFANGIQQPQFNSGLPSDMNNQSFNSTSVMTPPTLSTTPPIIKSNRKIAQMRLRRR